MKFMFSLKVWTNFLLTCKLPSKQVGFFRRKFYKPGKILVYTELEQTDKIIVINLKRFDKLSFALSEYF